MDDDGGKRGAGRRLYQSPPTRDRTQATAICRFWVAGNCVKGENCNWLHPGAQTAGSAAHKQGGSGNGWVSSQERQAGSQGSFSGSKRTSSGRGGEAQFSNSNGTERWGRPRTGTSRGGAGGPWPSSRPKAQTVPCKFWIQGDCKRGDNCNFLHAHTTATDIAMMTELKGHAKAIRGISLPTNSSLLYTGSQDETIRVWDCGTGQCTSVENMGDDVGSLMSDSGWLFVGQPGQVKTYNMSSGSQGSLPGPVGNVHVLHQFGGLLFAGCHNGVILVWRFNTTTSNFEPAVSLTGHSLGVVALTDCANRLYSASMDKTIRVWDLSTMQCVQTLDKHTGVVLGLLCWNSFLLSCSLDGTILVWSINATTGTLELTYTHGEAVSSSSTEAPGVLTIQGSTDASGNSVLLAAYTDNSVRLYDLPAFTERGALFTREEVRVLHVATAPGLSNIIFTGDSSGDVKVWRWLPASEVATSS